MVVRERTLPTNILLRRPVGMLVLVCVLLPLASGCGDSYGKTPSAYSVEGKVLAQGKPVTGAYVRFIPTELGGVEAEAELQADGSFVLKSIGDKAGGVPGKYKVFLDVDAPSSRPASVTRAAKAAIPSKYRNRDTTPLLAEIKTGDNRFTFELK